ncbi:MAG: NUDIX hydrolase [Acutalibacteraceae bacterium]
MGADMSVPCENGYINIRVGAIIIKDNKYLMVGNETSDYLYSVGGRIKFGETAEEAIIREVYEETGVKMEINRLGFVHENYFIGDSYPKIGKLIYEISFFFYMKTPDDFSPLCNSFTENGNREYLTWISMDEKSRNIYPDFFITELKHPSTDVKHFVTDDRML